MTNDVKPRTMRLRLYPDTVGIIEELKESTGMTATTLIHHLLQQEIDKERRSDDDN